jgi:hypothetical protein
MDQRALQNIVDVFQDFKNTYIAQATPFPEGPIPDGQEGIMFMRKGAMFFIQGEALAKFRKLVSKFNRKPWSDLLSDTYRSEAIEDAVVDAWDEADGGVAVFTNLASRFDSAAERFTVWIPLIGVDLQVSELRMGNVRLVRMTQQHLDNFLQTVSANTTLPDSVKEQYVSYISTMLNGLLNATCAEVSTVGDSNRAKELAEDACLPIIDVLQLLVALVVNRDMNVRVDFRSFEAVGYRPVLMISEEKQTFLPTQSRFGAAGACAITDAVLQRFKESGFSTIFDLLVKSEAELSEIERFILRAVHWFADGELQRNQENQLQSYVTCLDMFFSSRDGEATSAVQDGLAYLMGDNAEQRMNLYKFVGEMYDYRSRASHEGEDIDLPAKLNELRYITINFIAEMLRRRGEFRTKKALKEWVRAERMK